jgi:protein-S-isoprenylcysteine O-methyltransferase Ste14
MVEEGLSPDKKQLDKNKELPKLLRSSRGARLLTKRRKKP